MVSNNPNPFGNGGLFGKNGALNQGLQNMLSKPGGGIEAMFNGTAERVGQVFTSTPIVTRMISQMTQGELPPFLKQLQEFQITRQMLSALIKDALNLPKDPEQALRKFTKDPNVKETINTENIGEAVVAESTPKAATKEDVPLKQLMTQEVDLQQLQTLVKEGSQKAQQQVMKMMQSGDPTIARHGGELGKMASLFGKLAADGPSNKPLAKSVENFILLYLPFYPLVNPQQLQVDLESGGGGGAENSEHSITIYLKTATLGRFRVDIAEGQSLQLGITVWHEAIADQFIPHLAKSLKEYCEQHGLPTLKFEAGKVEGEQAQTVLETLANSESSQSSKSVLNDDVSENMAPGTVNFKGATQQEDYKKIHIQRGQSVTVLALNTAYHIAKVVFEADEQGRLLQKRKKNIQTKPNHPNQAQIKKSNA